MTTNNEKLYKKAFEDYLHTGSEDGLAELCKKVFNARPKVGYFLPPHAQLAVSDHLSKNCIMYKLVNKFNVDLIHDTVEHTDVRTSLAIYTHLGTVYNESKPSRLMIRDASYSLTNYIIGTLSGEWERLLNNALLHGEEINNKTRRPRGILTYPDGNEWRQIEQIKSGISGKITYSGLVKLQNSLMQNYQDNASWLINRNSLGLLKELRDGSGVLLFKRDKLITHMLGKPIHICDDIPTASHDSMSIVYGDFKAAYTIFEHPLISIVHDSINEAPRILLYSTKDIAGHVIDFNAIKILKLSA